MFKKTILSLSILTACSCAAFADGNAFTPLNFDDVAKSSASKPVVTSLTPEEGVGNTSMQNAIIQLDNAQVDVRNELLNYKTKFSDVDARYNAVKAERKALQKQVKSLENRIKKIDKQKENIRKNMI